MIMAQGGSAKPPGVDDPVIGRFLSADTIVPNPGDSQSLNRYMYVAGNPLKYIDPSGHANSCRAHDAGGGGGGGGTNCGGSGSGNSGSGGRPSGGGGSSGGSGSGSSSGGNPGGGGGNPGSGGGNPGGGGGGGGHASPIDQPPQPLAYSNDASTREAWRLVFRWFFEPPNTPTKYYYGPGSALTMDIMNDPGMDRFRKAWADTGYQLPFTFNDAADIREGLPLHARIKSGVEVYVQENVQLVQATIGQGSTTPQGPIDAVGGIIGSLDQISASYAGNGQVQIEVHNVMGLASLTRVPGTNFSVLQDRDRSKIGPGGTIEMYFVWPEPLPFLAR